MKLNQKAQQTWEAFFSNDENLGHPERILIGSDINSHVKTCWISALNTHVLKRFF
jgi:hypothetical protein